MMVMVMMVMAFFQYWKPQVAYDDGDDDFGDSDDGDGDLSILDMAFGV